MIPSNSYGEDFALFVVNVFSTRSLAFYRYDVGKLMLLLRKYEQAGESEWYAARLDPLSSYCGYMLAKMAERAVDGRRPEWLEALAGFLDLPGDEHVQQKDAFAKIVPEARQLIKKYGPDARTTIPPPSDEAN
ncbi:MAG: hypothetical protein PHC70_04275 [Patescibacteria group bacterium]|nr:hypothetical protein [Patescibacteria group bacterium]